MIAAKLLAAIEMMMNLIKRIFIFGLFFCLLSTAHAARPFIIDTDVGVDDIIAMLYLLNHDDITTQAITIASDGNAHCKPAEKNTLGILNLLKKDSIPVACGRVQPLSHNHVFTAAVLKESDTLAGTAHLLTPAKNSYNGSAASLLFRTLSQSKEPMDILAIGPLTNIAELLLKHPEIKNKIRMIYMMGGAVHVKGNIIEVDNSSTNQAAEWNFYLDPKAADIVFRSGVPLMLMPLDVTNTLPITMAFYEVVKRYQSPTGKYLYELFKRNQKGIKEVQWYFWDPLAAVIATDESIANCKNEKLRILLAPEEKSGATIVDNKNGNTVKVCYTVNKKQFQQKLLKVINAK